MHINGSVVCQFTFTAWICSSREERSLGFVGLSVWLGRKEFCHPALDAASVALVCSRSDSQGELVFELGPFQGVGSAADKVRWHHSMTALSKSILSGLAAALPVSSAAFCWTCYSSKMNLRFARGAMVFTEVGPDYDLAFLRACWTGVTAYIVVFALVLFNLNGQNRHNSEGVTKIKHHVCFIVAIATFVLCWFVPIFETPPRGEHVSMWADLRSAVYAQGGFLLVGNNQTILGSRPGPEAFLQASAFSATDGFILTSEAQPDRTYRLQSSTDFRTWTDLRTFTPGAELQEHRVPALPGESQRYFRIVSP